MSSKPITRIDRIDILPVSAYEIITIYHPSFGTPLKLPYYHSLEALGHSLPDSQLDVTDMLVKNKLTTIYAQAKGDLMKDQGILDKTLLIVDQSLEPKNDSIVLAVINEEFTCKRLKIKNSRFYYCPDNSEYNDIEITEDMNFRVWGIVTASINAL